LGLVLGVGGQFGERLEPEGIKAVFSGN